MTRSVQTDSCAHVRANVARPTDSTPINPSPSSPYVFPQGKLSRFAQVFLDRRARSRQAFPVKDPTNVI